MTAYIGTELIDGWANFWGLEISDENLEGMIQFALAHPEAALHRWGILAGPRPWLPDAGTLTHLAADAKYSIVDDLARQMRPPG